MSARFDKLALAGLVAVLALIILGWSSGLWDRVFGPGPQREVSIADVGPEECIETDGSGMTMWGLGEEEILHSSWGLNVVPMTGDYVDRRDDTLVCMTEGDVQAAAELEELEHQREKVIDDQACMLDGEFTLYEGSRYSAQDAQYRCLTDQQVSADQALTDELVDQIDAVDDSSWADKASAVVTLYCSIREDGARPVIQDNRERLDAALVNAYESGRTYTPGYPYKFWDAANEWCGDWERDDRSELPGQPRSSIYYYD